MSTTRSEIESLVFLMDDPDEFIRESVYKRIFELGESSVPLLDELRAKSKDEKQKAELKKIIHQITYESFQQEFISLLENGIYTMDDLEEGVFMLSRFDNPTIRTRQFKVMLDGMAAELEPRILRAGSLVDKMQIVLQFMYGQLGFEGCHSDYLNPRHSYLHHVIPNRIGIPLSLAMVLLFLARRLRLPFYGVNMPLHFLVKFETEGGKSLFIDPFNHGGILSREQCLLFLKKSGVKPSDAYFDRASEIEMLSRFMRNLINGYQQLKEEQLSNDLSKLLSLLESSRL